MKHEPTEKSCLFCKFTRKKLPTNIILENETVMVIEDINPMAPIHWLIIPKKHAENMMDLSDNLLDCAKDMFCAVHDLSKKLADPKAFKITCNNGKEAGQVVFHLHWHFLAGNF
jgi:histidine triad (HIT) family protein